MSRKPADVTTARVEQEVLTVTADVDSHERSIKQSNVTLAIALLGTGNVDLRIIWDLLARAGFVSRPHTRNEISGLIRESRELGLL